jgi:hypothetical protein
MLKSSSYKERGNTEDWPSRTHSAVMQDLEGGLRDMAVGVGLREEGGEGGEEMAWGRGGSRDGGRGWADEG